MSAHVNLLIADEASPDAGSVFYRFTSDDGVSSPSQKAPAAAQAVLKALFDSGEAAAVDATKAEAEAQVAAMTDRRAALDARLAAS